MKENLKKLAKYYKPYLGTFIIDMILAMMSAAVALVIPLVVRYITSKVAYMPAYEASKAIFTIVVILFVLVLDTVGVAEFFALLYIAYEVVSIFKNMALCGLPVKKVWEKVREFLAKYTDELPDTDELDGDSTTGNVEEHRTQER